MAVSLLAPVLLLSISLIPVLVSLMLIIVARLRFFCLTTLMLISRVCVAVLGWGMLANVSIVKVGDRVAQLVLERVSLSPIIM